MKLYRRVTADEADRVLGTSFTQSPFFHWNYGCLVLSFSSIASTFFSDRIHNTKKASENNPFDKPPLAYAGWVGSSARFVGSERLKTSMDRTPNISPIQDGLLYLVRFVIITSM